jgi:hypothetical protein
MPWWIMFFCPNWAFNIAKVGSKSLPKSEVKHCQSRKFGQLIRNNITKKAPALAGAYHIKFK